MIEVNNSMHFSSYFSIETSNRLVKWEYNLNGTYCPKTCSNSMHFSRYFSIDDFSCLISRLMNQIVHSLYSHKEIFLRELVSNASDALDKLIFLSVTDPSLLGDAGELEIRIKPDPEKRTITISDIGIGMTKEDLIDCLGTISQSGTLPSFI
uniref:Histidine kinase/HSP90-like ATPase domain-containing protein n=1 Tax=Lactuca sativa TaxID=4236 RepID=A0A9R1UDE8_LACSA|nr:hypothetical protein LSAT_V11C900503900 [Lactuca sativa]